MKLTKLSLAAITALSFTTLQADSLADAFKNGKVSGEARAFYLSYDDAGANKDPKMYSVGGKLAYETAAINGVSAGVAFYTVHDLGTYDSVEDNSNHFTSLDSNGDSFSLLGQAYLQYTAGNTMVKVGRQQLDTPLAGSDDIRIVPNLFEAYLVTNSDIKDTTLVGAYVTKMAGPIDSSANGETFSSMSAAAGVTGSKVGNEGVGVLAAVYSGLPNTTIQLWHYMATDVLDGTYADVSYEGKSGDISYTLGAQYWTIDSDDVVDTQQDSKVADYDISGLQGTLTYGPATLTAAMNTIDVDKGSHLSGTWGAYPEYVFSDEFWFYSISDKRKDVDATKFALDYDAGFATFTAAYASYDVDVANGDVDVLDIIANWECKLVKGLDITAVYEDQDYEAAGSDTDMLKLRLAYAF
jgi:hypothetical protein